MGFRMGLEWVRVRWVGVEFMLGGDVFRSVHREGRSLLVLACRSAWIQCVYGWFWALGGVRVV